MFYYHAKGWVEVDKYKSEKAQIQAIYHEHKGRYGYRRIHLALKRKGVELNHKTVQRLMQQMGLKSTVRPKRYSSYKGGAAKAAPNILARDFSASRPDQKWVTDVTEFKVKEQKVYLSPMIDVFNQEVVAYRVDTHSRLPLVTDMLKEAVRTLSPSAKPIVHSDQGWQYHHGSYRKILKDNGLTQSMSRKGNCLDNAVAENFFALLKTEMYHRQEFKDAEELIDKIKEYIKYYNTKRIKVKLKGLTPKEYRDQALQAV